jgi:hypothetical protein
MSAPPECCIAGADEQSWPCRLAWLVAFRSSSVSLARSSRRDCCFTPKASAPSPWLLLRSTSSALVCDHADASECDERGRAV